MGSDHAHVMLLSFPFGSHPASLFTVARALATAAPGATFSFLSTARSIASLPTPPSNIQFYTMGDGLPEGGDVPPTNVEEQIEMFLVAALENLRAGVEAAVVGSGGAMVTCVVTDAFLWMAAEVAAEAGVPWVPVWTGAALALYAHLHTDLLRRQIRASQKAISARADDLLHFLPGLSAVRFRDLPEGIVYGDLEGRFSLLLHRMAQQLPRAAAVAINTFDGVDQLIDADFPAKLPKPISIGPLHLLAPRPAVPDHYHCLSWLDRHGAATVVYVSFGTVASAPPGELAELADGLEASGVPFLWSLKETARQLLPPGFLDRTKERGLVVSWAPQVEVLGHVAVGAFVTHAGWLSVLEGITGGVVMVCRPFFGDHMMVARAVSYVWGVGMAFEGGAVTKEGLMNALEVVMKGEEGKRMRKRVGELKAMVVHAFEPGGSSRENFYQLLKIITTKML